ncbi:MAG: hypothetical protein NTZ69_16060 [Bacteroidia bacterium]|nr:hypothetical protein [Bacteroidia bacterium]
MNSNDGNLWFGTGIDNSQLKIDAAKAKDIIRGIGQTTTDTSAKMNQSFNGIGAGLAAMGGTTAVMMLGKQILDVTAKFEKFGIVLRNTLGDAKGTAALDMIANFAATTPFQLDEVTGAFIKMANQGFVPTQAEMVKLGDLASSTGKSFDQLTEALLDAQTGQFERLKEFGIKASQNGDKVTFSFKEQKTTVENTNSAIQAYILSLGTLKGVAGANALISASLTGQISNLQDKLSMMFNEVGKANKGLLYDAVGGVSALIDNYQAVGEALGVLIGIYGVYKVAVMAVAYEQKIATATALLVAESNDFLVASEARAIVMKERSAAAQKSLNASMLANPYVLAAVAVAALGYAIYKVITYQTDLEKSIEKTNLQIENERDKSSQLFAELKNAKEGTDEWKNAKQRIIDQYGTYLTAQQQEALGLNNLKEARDAVNKGIESTIALKIKEEALAGISDKYNSTITDESQRIINKVKKNAGADKAYEMQFKLADFISGSKSGTTTEEEAEKLKKELMSIVGGVDELGRATSMSSMDMSAFFNRVTFSISEQKKEIKSVTDAFNRYSITVKKDAPVENKPILTTYAAQRKALEDQKKKLETELAKAKITPDVDPTKKIVGIQGKIDEINKQLGVKETKEKLSAIEAVKKAMETAQGRELYLLTQKLAKLEAIKKIQEDIASGQRMKGVTDSGATSFDPTSPGKLSSKVAGGILKEFTDSIDPLAKKQDALNQKEIDNATKKMAKSNEAFQKEKDHQQWLFDDKLRKEAEEKKLLEEKANKLYQISDAFSSIANSIGGSNQGLADMFSGMSKLSGEVGNLMKSGAFTKKGMSPEDAFGATISGATQLIGLVVGQAAENKRVMQEYYASIISQQQEYNLLLNDQLRLNSDINGSVFLKNYEGTLNDSTKAFNDAQKKYQDELKKFNESEAITGKKKVVSGGNVLSGIGAGAALGAGIGTIVPVIGTAIGAVVGGLVGGLVGLFAKKTKDVTAPLLQEYGTDNKDPNKRLISETGEFNVALAKTLIANKQVTEESAKTLQNMIDWKEAADKATAQLKGVISELTSGLGDDLRNALVDAFKAGENAADKFKGSVNKVLENIMSNMIFNKAFEGAFKTLEDAMAASYAVGGDQSWLDDFQKFYAQSPDLIKNFNQGMSDAQKAAGDAGFNIFAKDATTTDTSRQATSKGFSAMSQETGNDLNGRFTAIQGHTFSISETTKIMAANSDNALKLLAGIEGNTAYCRKLESIESNMASLRAGIDTINLKGITLKP